VVWLPDEERDNCLCSIQELQQERNCDDGGPTFVFEGNSPADISTNAELNRLLESPNKTSEARPVLWLGSPNAIKGPAQTSLRRQGGDNILIVGQREEAALALSIIAVTALASQRPPSAAAFYVLDGTPSDDPQHGRLAACLSANDHRVHGIPYQKVPEAIAELAEELKRRQDSDATPDQSIYIVVYALQRYRKLRSDDDYSFSEEETPDKQFAELLREGPDLGIHLIIWCDTLNNLNRTLTRKTQREFDHRILFQMRASDSMSLMDSPAASQLGMTRALFYNEQEGIQETFTPYALPGTDWPPRRAP
jgi:hypothetical protein